MGLRFVARANDGPKVLIEYRDLQYRVGSLYRAGFLTLELLVSLALGAHRPHQAFFMFERRASCTGTPTFLISTRLPL